MNHSFVLGPARGIATLARPYLRQKNVSPSRVTMFLSEAEAQVPEWRQFPDTIAGRGRPERDAAMTAASDYNILRHETEAECRARYGAQYRPRISGTQQNEIRRREVAAAKGAPSADTDANMQAPSGWIWGGDDPVPLTAFVSGPLVPSPTYFAEHYARRIDAAIAQNASFVLGPSAGIDTLTHAYLRDKGVDPARITVYLSESEGKLPKWRQFADRLRREGVKVVVAGRGHTERDAAMTAASDYDILRYQTEAECRAMYGTKYRPRVSGTQLNEIRRQKAAARESEGDLQTS